MYFIYDILVLSKHLFLLLKKINEWFFKITAEIELFFLSLKFKSKYIM